MKKQRVVQTCLSCDSVYCDNVCWLNVHAYILICFHIYLDDKYVRLVHIAQLDLQVDFSYMLQPRYSRGLFNSLVNKQMPLFEGVNG